MRRSTSSLLILLTILCLGVGLGCYAYCRMSGAPVFWTSPRDPEYTKQIQQLEGANVEAEVAAAVEKGDLRFVAVMQVGPIVPGLPDDQWYKVKYKDVADTSDAIESAEHERLQGVAWAYAEKYNRALLKRLKSQPGK